MQLVQNYKLDNYASLVSAHCTNIKVTNRQMHKATISQNNMINSDIESV